MNTQTNPAPDVLAVMDRACFLLGAFEPHSPRLLEARAAVAQLIESASEAQMYFDNAGLNDYGLDAALARCGSET